MTPPYVRWLLHCRICHCEEGKSGAPDVAISRYYLSKLL